jgi:hypothetical protein
VGPQTLLSLSPAYSTKYLIPWLLSSVLVSKCLTLLLAVHPVNEPKAEEPLPVPAKQGYAQNVNVGMAMDSGINHVQQQQVSVAPTRLLFPSCVFANCKLTKTSSRRWLCK